MKWNVLQIFALLALTVATVKAVPEDSVDLDSLEDFSLDASDEDLLRKYEEKENTKDLNRENEIASKLAQTFHNENRLTSPVSDVDPCEKMHCGAGRICHAKGEKAECICIPDCPSEDDPRRQVCASKNVTWASDCEVYRQKCLCDTKSSECQDSEYKHIHINYYGQCKELPECTEDEMKDFPRRMRDWLFNVMRDLAERDELNEYYMQMELEAETNMTRRWSNAAIWKWCDLDGDTDRSVSRHELFPIRAPLVSLEHCIEPFLESCDVDNNHRITLKEWGKCLELDEDEIDERCDYIQKKNPHLG